MTFLGKLMVVLVAALSLAMLAWATAVYTHRLDWFPPKESGAQIKGRVDQLRERINQLATAAARAEYQWNFNRVQLARAEQQRAARRAWYAGQLELVRQGTVGGQPQQPPHVQKMQPDPATGLLPFNQPAGREAELDGKAQPLQNLTVYRTAIDRQLVELQDLQDQVAALVKEEEEWTNKIIDRQDPATGKAIKGLRTLISDQVRILRDSEAEQTYLMPYLTNRRAEVALVRKRQDSLQARVNEVKQYFGIGAGR